MTSEGTFRGSFIGHYTSILTDTEETLCYGNILTQEGVCFVGFSQETAIISLEK
jgi:hypothetical protein